MNEAGYIKLHRSLLSWEWHDVPCMMAIWVTLLAMANREPGNYHGQVVPVGSLITSYRHLSQQTGISINQVRECLRKLQKTGEITVKATQRNTLINIVNYSKYQCSGFENHTLTDTQTDTVTGTQSGTPAGTQTAPNIRIKNKESRIYTEKENTKEKAGDESEPPAEGIEISDFPFETFWSMYPKHTAERAAQSAFNSATIGTDPKVIISGLKKVIDLQWSRWPEGKQEQFIPNAVNWLKGERWKDDVKSYEPEKNRNQSVKLPEWKKAEETRMDDQEFFDMMGWKEIGNGDHRDDGSMA